MLLKSLLGVVVVLGIGTAGAYLIHHSLSHDLPAEAATETETGGCPSCCPMSAQPACTAAEEGCCGGESEECTGSCEGETPSAAETAADD